MSSRGGNGGSDRKPRDKKVFPDDPAADADPIEIIEVVGVDETTGVAAPAAEPKAPPERRSAGHPHALEAALREKDKYYDLLLRKQAEFDNFRKRSDREREEFRAAAAADLVRRLLPVLDNLDRALRTEAEGGSLRQGVTLIQQQLLEVLRKEGVRALDALGAPFDPRLHEAVEVVDVEGFEQGVILEEVQKGYTLHDRLLRPAAVKVASGKGPRGSVAGGGTGD
jgi:molecular chaperone GrpE